MKAGIELSEFNMQCETMTASDKTYCAAPNGTKSKLEIVCERFDEVELFLERGRKHGSERCRVWRGEGVRLVKNAPPEDGQPIPTEDWHPAWSRKWLP